jgi:hypothetical protein
MEITALQLKDYTKKTQPKRWKCYDESVKLYDALRIHANGEFPARLIQERRPSESPEIHKYRQTIYEPVTQGPFSKILTSLGKIRKASGWGVKYDQTKVPKSIADDETPEQYFGSDFPYFESVENWIFNVALKNYLIDSNAVAAVYPLDMIDLKENEYLEPYPVIFNSPNVYWFEEDSYCVLYSTDKSTYKSGNVTRTDGDIYFVLTDERVQKYEQINAKGDLQLTIDYQHDLGYMPAFRLKGLFEKALDKTIMWKSRIAGIVPRFNDAAREYSDLQAEVVQHIHSTMWVYATQDCAECRGIGQTVNREGRHVTCEVCKGMGKINTSPYTHQVIRAPQMGETPVPNPPMGYIEKDIEIVKVQDERIDTHIYKGLSAINMEFLQDTPLNESGTAKEVDRDELNVFVNSIANDLVNIMRLVEQICIDYRYRVIITSDTDRAELVPIFSVPMKFDLLSSNGMIDDIQTAKTGKVDPAIVNEMEIEFAAKKFNTEPDVQALVRLTLTLDPFPGIDDESKMVRMQNGGISKPDYIVSCNIHQFVKRAIEEDPKFVTLDYDDQREVLEEFAQEISDANDQATQLKLKMAQQSMGAPGDGSDDDDPANTDPTKVPPGGKGAPSKIPAPVKGAPAGKPKNNAA